MADLSSADRRLLRCVLAGHTMGEIAWQESLSENATRAWLQRVMQEISRARSDRHPHTPPNAHPRPR